MPSSRPVRFLFLARLSPNHYAPRRLATDELFLVRNETAPAWHGTTDIVSILQRRSSADSDR
jgi:hypothetical protein